MIKKATYLLGFMTMAISTTINARADGLNTPLNFSPYQLYSESECKVKSEGSFMWIDYGKPVSQHCTLRLFNQDNSTDGITHLITLEQDFTDPTHFVENENKFKAAADALKAPITSAKQVPYPHWVVFSPGKFNIDNISGALHVGRRLDDPNATVAIVEAQFELTRILNAPRDATFKYSRNLLKIQSPISIDELPTELSRKGSGVKIDNAQ